MATATSAHLALQASVLQVGSQASSEAQARNVRAAGAQELLLRGKRTPSWVLVGRQYLGAISGAVVMLVLSADYATGHDPHTPWNKALRLCYELGVDPADGRMRYGTGPDDVYFVAFWMAVLSLLRHAVIHAVVIPLGRAMKVKEGLALHKFAEQGWLALYYPVSCGAGLAVMMTNWDWLDSSQWWIGYPHNHHTFTMKLYYLMEMAFWFHCLVVTLVEEWRKDFVMMITHHFVTILLVVTSYWTNFVRLGTVVMVEQDVADIFLPVAKMLKYAKWDTAAMAMFGIFTLSWIPTRHGVFFVVLYSIWTEQPALLPMIWDPDNGCFCSEGVKWGFLAALSVLQLLMILWLRDVVAVIIKAAHGVYEDVRSDEEADDSKQAAVRPPIARKRSQKKLQ